MASVIISNIGDLRYFTFHEERTPNSTGELKLDERLVKIYMRNGYDSIPKTRKEADSVGEKHFNGLSSSVTYFSESMADDKKIVVTHLAPTRYLFSQAMKDFTRMNPDVSSETIKSVSPAMANVSLLVPVKNEGKYYLIAQIKGKAVGSGQIQVALVAGGVNDKDLYEGNPFINALKHETREESGLDLSFLNPTSFCYMIDELKIGNVNFVAVARYQKIGDILNAYESLTKRELHKGEDLEVMALSILDIAGLSLVPIEGKNKLENVLSYFPSEKGLESRKETMVVRPYTEAIVNWLNVGPKNVSSLLEKAGF